MCGRAYQIYTLQELEQRYWTHGGTQGIRFSEFPANYNLSPTQLSPVVVGNGEDRRIELMTWGLIPPWAKEFKTEFSTINAKAETLFESKLYRGPALKRRCIVPMSGFIEWKRDDAGKRPFCIHHKAEPIMSLAGVWETWSGGAGAGPKHSFSVITTAPNSFMEKIHNRMPVVLGREDEEAWLDPANSDQVRLSRLLKPCPSEWLDGFEVSTAINSPRNNRPEVLRPYSASM